MYIANVQVFIGVNNLTYIIKVFYLWQKFDLGSSGFPRVYSDEIPDFFSDQASKFYWFLVAWKYAILTFAGIHIGHRDARKNVAAIIWQKRMICHFYVPYQLSYRLIYKMSKYYRNTSPGFLTFLVSDYETEQPHHGTEGQHFKWGLHSDNNSIFSDFFLTCWWISKLSGPYQKFLTFSWPVGILEFSFQT